MMLFRWNFLVSIHAPARGATGELNTNLVNYQVSIHAPARGATYARLYIDQGTRYSPQIANLIA